MHDQQNIKFRHAKYLSLTRHTVHWCLLRHNQSDSAHPIYCVTAIRYGVICGACVRALHTATYRIICYRHPKTHITGIWKLVSLNSLHCFAKHHLCAIFFRNTISKLTISMTDNNNNRLCLILNREPLLQASHVQTRRSFVGHMF